jgi:hypothetical protein
MQNIWSFTYILSTYLHRVVLRYRDNFTSTVAYNTAKIVTTALPVSGETATVLQPLQKQPTSGVTFIICGALRFD